VFGYIGGLTGTQGGVIWGFGSPRPSNGKSKLGGGGGTGEETLVKERITAGKNTTPIVMNKKQRASLFSVPKNAGMNINEGSEV